MANPSKPLAILQVDDCRDHCDLTYMAIRTVQPDCSVLSVYSGQEAISYLDGCIHRVEVPSLLLLDWRMPLRSGREVLVWTSRQPDLAAMVVIIVSGVGYPEDRAAAKALGAQDYVLKPQPGGFPNYGSFAAHLIRRGRELATQAPRPVTLDLPSSTAPADHLTFAQLCRDMRIDSAGVQSDSQEQHVVTARRRVTRCLIDMGWPSKRIAVVLARSARTVQRARK